MINIVLIDYNVLIWKKCTTFLIIIISYVDEFSITDIQVHRA